MSHKLDDYKILCPIGASDKCEFNHKGKCMMNCNRCLGMTHKEIDEYMEWLKKQN